MKHMVFWLSEIKAKYYLYSRKEVSFQARLIGAKRITLGRSSRIHPMATIDCRRDPYLGNGDLGESEVIIGEKSTVCTSSMILPYGGKIVIGNNCTTNPFTVLYGHGGLYIGNNTRIGCHSIFIPAQHIFESFDKPICHQGLEKQGIHIGDDVWVGANVTVLDGVTIGNGCIVAAQAVVTKSFPENCVIGGVPARILKQRDTRIESLVQS